MPSSGSSSVPFRRHVARRLVGRGVAPVDQDDDIVGEATGLGQVVGDPEHREPGAGQLDGASTSMARRLAGSSDDVGSSISTTSGPVEQGAGDAHPLRLATGEVVGDPIEQVAG